jgi:putative FmdB family regulatory protein
MPLYVYSCPCGYECEEIRKIAQRHDPTSCPRCDNELHLKIVPPKIHLWRPLELELETNKPKTYNSKAELVEDCRRLGKIMPFHDITGDPKREY